MPASASLTSKKPNPQTDAIDPAGIVIIGAGMAGSRFVIKLATALHAQSDGVEKNTSMPRITLVSKEPEVGYNRIMLSPVLAGETEFSDTYLYQSSEYERLGIRVLAGVSVENVDTTSQRIMLDNNNVLSYEALVFATGSTARVIPFPNHEAKGVHVFRDISDVAVLTDYAKQGKTGLVIGGGVLGLEAACALSSQGAQMTVVHVDGYVLNRQLDLPAAHLLQDELGQRNVGLEVSAMSTTIEINEAGEVTGLSLKDGRTLAADFIVMAVGITPNVELAQNSGLKVNRGIKVDEYMHTSCAHVYGIGECIEINDELFGMVSSVNQHVDTLVSVLCHAYSSKRAICDDEKQGWLPFVSQPLSLKLKVSGISVFSAGQIEFSEEEAIETIAYREVGSKHYHCLYVNDNRLVGAVLYGETSEGSFYSQLINEETDITDVKESLIYGAAYCELSEQNPESVTEPVINETGTAAITTDHPNKTQELIEETQPVEITHHQDATVGVSA